MVVLATLCAAEKNPARCLLPAVERYRSERIRRVYAAAVTLDLGFVILSGEHGLLGPRDPIHDYDHLLTAAEAPGLARRVADQLRERGITQVLLFLRPAAEDPLAAPYRLCLEEACRRAAVALTCVELPEES